VSDVIQRRVHLIRGTKPTEMQAREVLLRQLSRGDRERSNLIRTLPLFDVALNGFRALGGKEMK
jgi:hypothetical protein